MTITEDDEHWCELCARDAMVQGGVFVARRVNEDEHIQCSQCDKLLMHGQLVYSPATEDDDTEGN